MVKQNRRSRRRRQSSSPTVRQRLGRINRTLVLGGGIAVLVVAVVVWSATGGDATSDGGPSPVAAVKPSPPERAALAAEGAGLVRPADSRPAAAAVSVQTASYADGSRFEVAAERGNVVVFYFMAAWCFTCIPEAQALAQLHEIYADEGVRIVVLDVDQTEDEDDLARFREMAGGGRHLWAMDADFRVAQPYGVQLLDTTIVIDREGRVAYVDGVPTSLDRLQAVIEALL